MGYSRTRQLFRVELPLALPTIVVGIRIAVVTTIGLVTVTALIGQGGLGSLMLDGFKRDFRTPLTVGIVLSLALAVIADLILVGVLYVATPWRRAGWRAASRRAGATRRQTPTWSTFLPSRCTDVFDFFGDVGSFLGDGANWQGDEGIPTLLREHLQLSVVSVLAAIVIAVPIGILLGHVRTGGAFAINVFNIGRALPALALLILAVQWFGIGAPPGVLAPALSTPAFVAMFALAIPPILANTYVGVSGVDDDTLEAARGMGMNGGQMLRRVEIPLAVPLIMAGVRTAAVAVDRDGHARRVRRRRRARALHRRRLRRARHGEGVRRRRCWWRSSRSRWRQASPRPSGACPRPGSAPCRSAPRRGTGADRTAPDAARRAPRAKPTDPLRFRFSRVGDTPFAPSRPKRGCSMRETRRSIRSRATRPLVAMTAALVAVGALAVGGGCRHHDVAHRRLEGLRRRPGAVAGLRAGTRGEEASTSPSRTTSARRRSSTPRSRTVTSTGTPTTRARCSPTSAASPPATPPRPTPHSRTSSTAPGSSRASPRPRSTSTASTSRRRPRRSTS